MLEKHTAAEVHVATHHVVGFDDRAIFACNFDCTRTIPNARTIELNLPFPIFIGYRWELASPVECDHDVFAWFGFTINEGESSIFIIFLQSNG